MARFREILNTKVARVPTTLSKMFFQMGLRYESKHSGFHLPIPELGLNDGHQETAGRGKGTLKKWEVIAGVLEPGWRTALDIGSNTGYFSRQLAQKGLFTYSFEPDLRLLEVSEFVSHRMGIRNIAFSSLPVSPDNVENLPEADVTVFMSVIQNWYQLFGIDTGHVMLGKLWEKTRKVLIFETPNHLENSTRAPYMPAMGSNETECRAYIHSLLERVCPGGKVEFLHYGPTDFRIAENRHLFHVKRS